MKISKRYTLHLAIAGVVVVACSVSSLAFEPFGYIQSTVGALRGDPDGTDAEWYNNVRLSLDQDIGVLRLEMAYEFAIDRTRPGEDNSTDWLDLQGSLSRGRRLESRHRVDRMQLSWSPTDVMEVSIGRQAISWGTTLFFAPADPFAPFSPSDTFREYRRGVDAIRIRAFPNALSELDIVVRPSRLGDQEELTILGRGLTTWNEWEVSAWAGSLYGDAAFAVGAAGGLASWGVRFETAFRDTGNQLVGRGAVGVFRDFLVGERDLGVVVEYQHDGLGASANDEIGDVLESDFYRRGELQGIGRNQFLVQAAYQIHPLWNISGLALWNQDWDNGVLAPGFSYSVSDNATLTGSVFTKIGNQASDGAASGEGGSEPGEVFAHLSLTWYL